MKPCRGFLRYVDDFMLFAEDKQQLWAWQAMVQERLAHFRLTIHPGSHPHPVTEGIPFLGFQIYPDRRRLKRRKGVQFQRKFRQLLRQYEAGEIPLAVVTASVQGWVNHVRFGNTVGLRKVVLRGELIPSVKAAAD
jgi:hypothetical protein